MGSGFSAVLLIKAILLKLWLQKSYNLYGMESLYHNTGIIHDSFTSNTTGDSLLQKQGSGSSKASGKQIATFQGGRGAGKIRGEKRNRYSVNLPSYPSKNLGLVHILDNKDTSLYTVVHQLPKQKDNA